MLKASFLLDIILQDQAVIQLQFKHCRKTKVSQNQPNDPDLNISLSLCANTHYFLMICNAKLHLVANRRALIKIFNFF